MTKIFILLSLLYLSEYVNGYYYGASGQSRMPEVEVVIIPGVKTRSLSGGKATDGNNATNAMVLELMRVGLVGGYAVRRIKMFNDRVYLARYRRSYWFGTRYYAIDNRYFLETRDTCMYRMNETERDDLEYEENGEPILDVVYQNLLLRRDFGLWELKSNKNELRCQRYAQYCCGLDCCQYQGKRWVHSSNSQNSLYSISNSMLVALFLISYSRLTSLINS